MADGTDPSTQSPWSGRHDGDGPEHARWHQLVRPTSDLAAHATAEPPGPAVSLLGFCSDEGVRRNQGRVGAAQGPRALRSALAPLAPPRAIADGRVTVVDHGDAVTRGEDLEAGHREAADLIATAMGSESTCREAAQGPISPTAQAAPSGLTVVLGGGHETAWASYLGLMGSARMAADQSGRVPRWGVLNLDAHFDLRRESRATSGTPFLQMAEAEAAAGRRLEYAVVGISEASNTGALFNTARELGVHWMSDLECLEQGATGVRAFVEEFARDLEALYLTIDLDVLPAAAAPGVSAPAALGVPLPLIVTAVQAAASSGALALLDVVELNPSLDVDSRTARTAARLIDLAVRGHLDHRADCAS